VTERQTEATEAPTAPIFVPRGDPVRDGLMRALSDIETIEITFKREGVINGSMFEARLAAARARGRLEAILGLR
jgi:hypothetical protein